MSIEGLRSPACDVNDRIKCAVSGNRGQRVAISLKRGGENADNEEAVAARFKMRPMAHISLAPTADR